MIAQPFSHPRILVFDSGVGGLSILQAITSRVPGCERFYLSDNAAFPYGTKTEAELIARVSEVMDAAIAHIQPDLLVIACNTASTLTLPVIRSRFSLPVVGVVPAIKPAAQFSRSRVIGLLATPATVVRPYTQQLITDYAAKCTVISVGSSDLVWLAEQKLRGESVSDNAIRTVLEPFYQHPAIARMDTLVLACTHFPLVAEEISRQLPANVTLIDSGEAIARRVQSLLPQLSPDASTATPEHRAFFTKATAEVEQLRPALARLGLPQTAILDIPLAVS